MNDLKFAFRQLLRQPGFSLLAALSFALGIGLVATQFSLIDAILLRGLPIPDAQRLVHVARVNAQTGDSDFWETVPVRDFLAMKEQQTVLEAVAAVNQSGFNVGGDGRIPTHQDGASATANLLNVLGVRPQLGRWFEEGEDLPGQPMFIVLSHGYWKEEFGGDPGALGRSLTINGEMGTIIGVMPQRFSFPNRQRLWTNLRAASVDPRDRIVDRVEMVGKLKAGISIKQALAEFNTMAARLAKEYPEMNTGYEKMNLEKFAHAYAGGGTEPILYLMLAMTVFILILSCVNVANMLMGRVARRARELAVRVAIGASRWRLMRQILVETLVLAFVGAAGGLLLAHFGVGQLRYQLVERMNVPGWFEFQLDHRVVFVGIVATLGAGLLAGLIPAWPAFRVNVNGALKDESRGASSLGLGRVSRWLVTAQIGFASMLLVAASVLGWTVIESRRLNLGFEPERLLSGRIELHDATHPERSDRIRFYEELMTRLSAEPGVEAVAVTSRDLISPGVQTRVAPEGAVYVHENDRPYAWLEVVSLDYFRMLDVGAVSGRVFDTRDNEATVRAAVVNESFARQFWPDKDPLGQRFRSEQTKDDWVTVVGVVRDLQMQGWFSPPNLKASGFYLVQDQMGWGWLNLFVRTHGDPLQLVGSVRRAVAELDPKQPVHSIGTLAEHTARQIHGFSVVGVMAGIFALITLFLGAVGVYGVTSFAVNQRTREFGIRMALGSTMGGVVRLVLVQGARQMAIGVGFGLCAAYIVTRPMQGVFGEDLVNSPLIYGLVVFVIGWVGMLALLLPARRAAGIDPMEALRGE